jgi:hypothetical protein
MNDIDQIRAANAEMRGKVLQLQDHNAELRRVNAKLHQFLKDERAEASKTAAILINFATAQMYEISELRKQIQTP